MDKVKSAIGDDEEEELRAAVAAMSDDEKVQFWLGFLATGGELARTLFFDTLLRDGAAGYEPQPKEDRPTPTATARFFEPLQPPPPANKPAAGSPPVTVPSRVTVLALCAPGAPHPGSHRRDNNRTRPSTTAERAAQGKKPRCTSLVQKPPRPPSTPGPDQAPPQNSFKTAVTVLCAPPQHLAREMKRPPTSTECASEGKKHRAV